MVTHYTSLVGVNLQNTWLTIGSYDGVHLGHQQLIKELNYRAHQVGAKSVVLSFHPHPSEVLRGRKEAFYLTTTDEKLYLLEDLHPDIVIIHPFSLEISRTPARDFILYLMDHLAFRQLWTGDDFALGKNREGNVAYLSQLGNELNYQVQMFTPVLSGGRKISSSRIRNLLTDGHLEEANKLLGRSYEVSGEVIHGDGRGKRIGIPTANLESGSGKLIPAAGVYACQAQIQHKTWLAAVNIGTRPTFEDTNPRVNIEAHILDFSDDLYNQEICLQFYKRIRGEQRFSRVEELIDQIHTDIINTRKIFSK
jgi:riboflavin kinase/FMN adenylyltransferase